MCGICGGLYFKNKPSGTVAIEQMLGKMHHRGPDAQRVRKYGPLIMGHARLKIIDTSNASNQPFETSGGNGLLVYNGECYNYKHIKAFLTKTHQINFTTRGDTEVLAKLLDIEGINGLKRVNGMFAFAHWNSNRNILTLARDRVGIKPLYYVKTETTFYFASEFRSLLTAASSNSINRQAVSEYLAYQCNGGSDTLHPDIKRVMPGECLEITQSGEITKRSYYHLSSTFSEPKNKSFGAGELKHQFFEAVKRRLISDVPLGAFLSGGIDSTAIVAAMHELGSSTIKTFNLGFEDQCLDERQYAQHVAHHFDTDHQEVTLGESQILSHIREAVDALDMPSGDAINTYLISKYTKEAGLTVALSGLGGDELFGGYPSAAVMERLKYLQWLKHLPKSIRKAFAGLIIRGQTVKAGKLRDLFSGNMTPEAVVSILRRVLSRGQLTELGLPQYHMVSSPLNMFDTRNGIACHELIMYTIPLLLKDTDQTSMAHSLEVRVPFLDHQFVEYAASYPQLRDPNYDSFGYTKGALIEAMDPLIPEMVYNRPKKGFVLPMNRWMKNELAEFTQHGLLESPLPDLMPKSTLETYWNTFLANSDERLTWSRIWTLSTLGHWMQNNGLRA